MINLVDLSQMVEDAQGPQKTRSMLVVTLQLGQNMTLTPDPTQERVFQARVMGGGGRQTDFGRPSCMSCNLCSGLTASRPLPSVSQASFHVGPNSTRLIQGGITEVTFNAVRTGQTVTDPKFGSSVSPAPRMPSSTKRCLRLHILLRGHRGRRLERDYSPAHATLYTKDLRYASHQRPSNPGR